MSNKEYRMSICSSFIIPCSLFIIPFIYCAIFFMVKEKILVIGACGQIGVELTLALRKIYGGDNVIATDIKGEHPLLTGTGPYAVLNAMDGAAIHEMVKKENITQIYLLAALLSATGEK